VQTLLELELTVLFFSYSLLFPAILYLLLIKVTQEYFFLDVVFELLQFICFWVCLRVIDPVTIFLLSFYTNSIFQGVKVD